MNSSMVRYGLVSVAVIGFAVLGWRFLPTISVGPAPTATAMPTPSASAVALSSAARTGPLAAGRYSFRIVRGFGHSEISGELTLPKSWSLVQRASSEAAFARADGAYVGFFRVRDVYRDPCHPERGTYGSRSLGSPNGQDIVQGLRSMKGFTSSVAEEESLGIHFLITNTINTDSAGCTDGGLLPLFVTEDGNLAQELHKRSEHSPATNGGTVLEFWIVRPADDTVISALVIVAEEGRSRDRAELDQVLASIQMRQR